MSPAVALGSLAGVSYLRPDARTATVNDDAALRRVAAEFEAMFLMELLKTMRATQLESGLLGNDRSTKMYREMHDEALANSLAGSGERDGGFGIGRMLYEELRRQHRPG